ncbi:MAG: hypothetical protein ACREN8_06785 [Candidatus Dormibacteraceae bacterium]
MDDKDGDLTSLTPQEAEAQLFQMYAPLKYSLADELVAERHAEALRDLLDEST